MFLGTLLVQLGAMDMDSATATPSIAAIRQTASKHMSLISKLICAKYQRDIAILQNVIYINVNKTSSHGPI